MFSLWLVLQLAGAAPALPPVPADPRLERLTAWLAAVEMHAPGVVDAPALVVRWWDRAALTGVHEDMFALASLVRDRGAAIQLYRPTPGGTLAPSRGYSANQIGGLRIIAEGIRQRAVITELLKRGALLHTDIAFRVPVTPVAMTAGVPAALQRTTLYLDDGRQQGLNQSVGHLEMARRLLDLVRPNPERDDKPYPERDAMVRHWYRATTAILIDKTNLDLDGLRTARLPTGVSYRVDSERDELRRAEGFFRRALAVDSLHREARVRLGYVIGLLGRPGEAVKELRAALDGALDPHLRYYGELFLGRELDALGQRDAARAAYERAASLYPLAQSPVLGSSELAMRAGDRPAAQAAMKAVWRLADVADDHDDPLWNYNAMAGRTGERRLDEVNAMLPAHGEATR